VFAVSQRRAGRSSGWRPLGIVAPIHLTLAALAQTGSLARSLARSQHSTRNSRALGRDRPPSVAHSPEPAIKPQPGEPGSPLSARWTVCVGGVCLMRSLHFIATQHLALGGRLCGWSWSWSWSQSKVAARRPRRPTPAAGQRKGRPNFYVDSESHRRLHFSYPLINSRAVRLSAGRTQLAAPSERRRPLSSAAAICARRPTSAGRHNLINDWPPKMGPPSGADNWV